MLRDPGRARSVFRRRSTVRATHRRGSGDLLLLNVIELWFARYPNVEMLIQALLFASLLAAARAQVDGDPFFAPVAGLLLGLLLFTRFDTALVVVAVIAAQALGYVALTQRMHWTFWPALALPAALCAWYLVGPMRAYRSFRSHSWRASRGACTPRSPPDSSVC